MLWLGEFSSILDENQQASNLDDMWTLIERIIIHVMPMLLCAVVAQPTAISNFQAAIFGYSHLVWKCNNKNKLCFDSGKIAVNFSSNIDEIYWFLLFRAGNYLDARYTPCNTLCVWYSGFDNLFEVLCYENCYNYPFDVIDIMCWFGKSHLWWTVGWSVIEGDRVNKKEKKKKKKQEIRLICFRRKEFP